MWALPLCSARKITKAISTVTPRASTLNTLPARVESAK
jgi:hypothetical protein